MVMFATVGIFDISEVVSVLSNGDGERMRLKYGRVYGIGDVSLLHKMHIAPKLCDKFIS